MPPLEPPDDARRRVPVVAVVVRRRVPVDDLARVVRLVPLFAVVERFLVAVLRFIPVFEREVVRFLPVGIP